MKLAKRLMMCGHKSDPYWDYVSICINATHGILDTKGHAINILGNVAISTTLGYPTIYFDGVSDYITIQNFAGIELGTGDFCVEYIGKLSNSNVYQAIYSKGAKWGAAGGLICLGHTNGSIYHAFGNTTWLFLQYTPIDTNLHHVAFLRHGSTMRVIIDGVLKLEGVISGDGTGAPSYPLVIGNDRDFNAPQSPMHITAFRVTKGVPRYTAAFSPLASYFFPTS